MVCESVLQLAINLLSIYKILSGLGAYSEIAQFSDSWQKNSRIGRSNCITVALLLPPSLPLFPEGHTFRPDKIVDSMPPTA